MTVAKWLERILFGTGKVKDREIVGQQLAEERESLIAEQRKLVGSVRQHSQITGSGAKVLENMTHAMILMEARNGGVKK